MFWASGLPVEASGLWSIAGERWHNAGDDPRRTHRTMEHSQDRSETRRLLKCAEAARMLNVSSRKVWSLASEGALPKIRLGRAVRFDVRDLEVLIASSREAATT